MGMVTEKYLIKTIKRNIDNLTSNDLIELINNRFPNELIMSKQFVYDFNKSDKNKLFDIFIILIKDKDYEKIVSDKLFQIINEISEFKIYQKITDKFNFDSLDMMDLELTLEKRFDIEIIEDNFWRQKWSVKRLFDFINQKYIEKTYKCLEKIIFIKHEQKQSNIDY